ncbi:MAG: GNAT family N-acetyltransferase [Polyangiales bacterium]
MAPTHLRDDALKRPIELHTERLLLREWRDSDLDEFAAMNVDERVSEYFPKPRPTRADSEAMVARIRAHFDREGYGAFAVSIKGGAPFAGFIGLWQTTFSAHFTPCVEIAWRLKHECWGKGYATEGAKAALRFGFEALGLDEIVSFTVQENTRSRRVMEKLGMHHNARDDFDHPNLPEGHPLKRHVLYRIRKSMG